MELWIRYKQAAGLEWDQRLEVGSQQEWRQALEETRPLSSILWPREPLFPVVPVSPAPQFRRRHPHERSYRNEPQRNLSYLEAAQRLAEKIRHRLGGEKTLVYAPMRGALPIWKAVSQFLPDAHVDVYYPVTSSFVFYPREYRIFNRKGRPASGRFTHVLELKRLRPCLNEYTTLLYIDEIVSGGMMAGYLKEMMQLELYRDIHIVAAGLADAFGERSSFKRGQIQAMKEQGMLRDFLWEGCSSLITEDQKFLLGVHYVDYQSGPNLVPVLTPELSHYEEKLQFDKDVFGR